MSGVQTALWLGIDQPAMQWSVVRGGKTAHELSLVLFPNKALKIDRAHV